MAAASPIDLSALSLPDAVEALDYETLLAARRAVLLALAPELAEALALESEPLIKLLEVGAYRELILRAAVNDSVRAVMLATATGTDLDHLAALLGVERQVLVEADPNAIPPVAEVLEGDTSLRRRVQLAPEGMTKAGTVGAYTYHALRAHGRIRDVGVSSPGPGQVLVTVLSHDDDGQPSAEVLAAVTAVLVEVRPLCDDATAAAPVFVDFAVAATLHLTASPGAEVVLAAAEAAVAAYLDQARAVGRVVRRSALIAALHQPGVETVVLTAPAADVAPGITGVARASAPEISVVYPS